MTIEGVIAFSHQILAKTIKEGDIVIDATLGNGNDTLFLAKLVGEKGLVYGFDVQSQAVGNTQKRLEGEGLLSRAKLLLSGHENMLEEVDENYRGNIRAITFNLGYLPGSDKEVITQKETTIRALNSGIDLLASGGIISIIVYTGHPGGEEEGDTTFAWAKSLDNKGFSVLSYSFVNKENNPPYLLLIEKK